jgi:hypothetical protein
MASAGKTDRPHRCGLGGGDSGNAVFNDKTLRGLIVGALDIADRI